MNSTILLAAAANNLNVGIDTGGPWKWCDTQQLAFSAATEFLGGDYSTSGDNLLMGPAAGFTQRIASLVLFLSSGASVNVFFKSTETGEQISPTFALATATPLVVLPLNSAGWIQAPKGEGIILHTSGVATVGVAANVVFVSNP